MSSTPENSQIEAKNEALVQIIYPFQPVNTKPVLHKFCCWDASGSAKL